MGYKVLLGFGELVAGVALAVPAFDPLPRFRTWAAAERRHDPNDLLAGIVSRHVPSFLPHRGLVVAILLVLGLAKLIAATAMFYGREWGVVLLAAIVAAALPVDVGEAAVHPSVWHVLFAAANAVVLFIVVTLGWRRRRPVTSDGRSVTVQPPI